MLLILTAARQAGKTRWLEACVSELDRRGVRCCGVVAPGRWRRLDDGTLLKVGIDNVLLPGEARIDFAARAGAGGGSGHTQARGAGLGWDIHDEAIARVNQHFCQLRSAEAGTGSLLVIDELGPLELVRGGGLTEAVALLDEGPRDAWPHAMVVVRPELVGLALGRWRAIWGGAETIGPSDAALSQILTAVAGG